MIERHPSIEPAHPGEILREDILSAANCIQPIDLTTF